MNQRVTIVNIQKNGSDSAVFLNDALILSADPGAGDSSYPVELVAESLAKLHEVEIQRVDVSPTEDWNWDEVAEHLTSDGTLTDPVKKFSLKHTMIHADGHHEDAVLHFDSTTHEGAVRKIIDFYKSEPEALLWVEGNEEAPSGSLIKVGDEGDDYHLSPGCGNSAWIAVGNMSVYIKQESEGVVVDVFPLSGEMEDPIASAWAMYSEVPNKEDLAP